jgi:hypothetical protein
MSRVLLFLLRLILWGLRKEAVRLNLWVYETGWPENCIGGDMAKIGDSFTARIAPTNAAGAPAPVFNVDYFEEGDSYDFSVAPDGLSVVFVARNVGVANLARVEARTNGGNVLTETVSLPDVEANVDLEAVALNFTVA